MHKARENANGSFSIGKTWNFEDLSAIESYTNRASRNEQEAQSFRWAGDTGFAVTLLKPYFWQTKSVQEKSYFIASLAKIFKRYTAGKIPQLVGFTPDELEQIHAYADAPAGSTTQRPPSRNGGASAAPARPVRASDTQQRPGDSPTMPPSHTAPRRSPYSSTTDLNNSQSNLSDPYRNPPSRPSRDQRNPYSSDTTLARLTPQSSNSDLPPTQDPDSLIPASRRGPAFYQAQAERPISRDSNHTNGLGITGGAFAARKLNGGDHQNVSEESLPRVAPAPIPERRRPPMNQIQEPKFHTEHDTSAMVKPLTTRRTSQIDSDTPPPPPPPPVAPPLKSPQRYAVGGSQIPPLGPDGPAAIPTAADVKKEVPQEEKGVITEDTSAPTEKKSEEARPGLGRMFGGNKKSTRELFTKAANAYTTFKPRAGGAGARMIATAEPKSAEPDGITEVVPARRLQRTDTGDSNQGALTSPLPAPVGASTTMPTVAPDVTITSPTSPPKAMNGAQLTRNIAAMDSNPHVNDLQMRAAELQQRSKEEAAKRKLRRTPQQLKYLDRLGIDSGLLDGQGLEYETLLEEFWPEVSWHKKSVDALQADLRREISSVQTGGWFEHIARHDEERNAAITLIDSALDECDQLEKLLTIYSVELGVSYLTINPELTNFFNRAYLMILPISKHKDKVYRFKPRIKNFSCPNYKVFWIQSTYLLSSSIQYTQPMLSASMVWNPLRELY
jgi:hypothetical protein